MILMSIFDIGVQGQVRVWLVFCWYTLGKSLFLAATWVAL